MTKRKNDTGLNTDNGVQSNPDPFAPGPNLYAPEPDVSDDELGTASDGEDKSEDTSEHKEYMVHRDGTVINGELLNQGDYVTLHPDVAKAHTDADVRLTEVKSAA